MKQESEKYSECLDKLRGFPLFEDIDRESLKPLLNMATLKTWPKKKIVINSTSRSHYFYLIFSGRIKAYSFDMKTGRQLTLFLLTTNDAFDICTLTNQCDHKLNYASIDKTVMLSIPLLDMRLWMERNPESSKSIFKYMAIKMLQLQTYLTEMSLEDTQTRLAKLLLKYMNCTSKKIEMINNLSHDELAMFIGTTRAVLNRHIQEFKEQGIIGVSRKHISILDADELTKKTIA